METVFITIHDLSLDARIKYCSDSVEDILGYQPHEVRGKSCWEYFHPDEIPFAQAVHGRGLALDKAASLNYCRIKHKDGHWVGCECVFTVVHDVLVASTAIYQRGLKAERRAIDGACVRRIFSSSPRDPRYHMLSYISNKFTQDHDIHEREPRAALIINRYSRTSPILFATNGVQEILGFQPYELIGKSFYYCIAENCLSDAIRTLESAKGNDSIAYLRFFFRNPYHADLSSLPQSESNSDDEDAGGVALHSSGPSRSATSSRSPAPINENIRPLGRSNERSLEPIPSINLPVAENSQPVHQMISNTIESERSRTSSGDSTDMEGNTSDAIFDPPSLPAQSSASSVSPQGGQTPDTIELEAVVSCTSDGLVVVLRRAKPMMPPTATSKQPFFPKGLFASPWASDPVMPPGVSQTTIAPSITFPPSSEPVESGFMAAIRDVAVFAWSLTGINGELRGLAHGIPSGEALPPGGLPVWNPNATDVADNRYNGFSGSTHRPLPETGDSTVVKSEDTQSSSSEDEILWKRVPQMPALRKPKRRQHADAFGAEENIPSATNETHQQSGRRRRRLDDGSQESST